MILYIMRHAEAVERSDSSMDEWRYLTEKGRKVAEKIASSLQKTASRSGVIISSPMVRAVQTAEIMARKACRKSSVITSGLLLPGAEIEQLVACLKDYSRAGNVMLVGHEPHLGSLVTSLLRLDETSIALKKGGCAVIEFDPEKTNRPAHFLCYLPPGKKRITSLKKAFPQK